MWLLFFKTGAMMKTPVDRFEPGDLARAGFKDGWDGAWLCDQEPDLDQAKKAVESGKALGSLDCTLMLYMNKGSDS